MPTPDADHGDDAGIDVETDAHEIDRRPQQQVGEIHRDQQNERGDERTVGTRGYQQHGAIDHTHDQPVVTFHHMVDCLLQRDHAGAESHAEIAVLHADGLNCAARAGQDRVDRLLLIVLVPQRNGRVLKLVVGNVAEIDRVAAEQHSVGGGADGRGRHIQWQPLGVAAGEQAIDLAHVIGECQRCTRHNIWICFHQPLQFGGDLDYFGRAGDAIIDVFEGLCFCLEDDLERVGTREVCINRAHRGVELGLMPQQIAALDGVADLDLRVQVDSDGADDHDHHRRGVRGLAEGQLRQAVQKLLLQQTDPPTPCPGRRRLLTCFSAPAGRTARSSTGRPRWG